MPDIYAAPSPLTAGTCSCRSKSTPCAVVAFGVAAVAGHIYAAPTPLLVVLQSLRQLFADALCSSHFRCSSGCQTFLPLQVLCWLSCRPRGSCSCRFKSTPSALVTFGVTAVARVVVLQSLRCHSKCYVGCPSSLQIASGASKARVSPAALSQNGLVVWLICRFDFLPLILQLFHSHFDACYQIKCPHFNNDF